MNPPYVTSYILCCLLDTFSQIPGKIANGDTGLVADESYLLWEKDIDLIENMGLSAYRFSISWPRILPLGNGEVNREGLDYYNKIINRLLELKIEPFVTIYHWDLPQALEDEYGGWLSPEIERDFVYYADVLFREYGDRVTKWITINEPWTFCYLAYVKGAFAPGRCSDRSKCPEGDSPTEGYIAAHNVLIAHAAVVNLYRVKYQPSQKGTIGITLNMDWSEPYTDSEEDQKAAERSRLFLFGWFVDPIYFGKYPQAMVENVGDRLPTFTPAQRELVKGSTDFIGLNHYSSKFVMDTPIPQPSTGWSDDIGVNESNYNTTGYLIGPQGDSAWLHVVPWGFYKLLKWVKNRYNNPLVYITENGCDVPGESSLSFEKVIQDDFRISYYSQYLKALDQAIIEGSNIRGYFAWSLLDNFEWADGYSFRFGLHYVNYSDPFRTRYPKASSLWYADYAKNHAYHISSSSSHFDIAKHRSINWKDTYEYQKVLGLGTPIYGAYGTGY
jgi:beta-glucosidase